MDLVDVSDIFYFFCSGRGGVRSAGRGGGGIGFVLKIPGKGGGSRRGAEGPGGCLWRTGEFGGVGAKFFFSGAETSTKWKSLRSLQPPITQDNFGELIS